MSGKFLLLGEVCSESRCHWLLHQLARKMRGGGNKILSKLVALEFCYQLGNHYIKFPLSFTFMRTYILPKFKIALKKLFEIFFFHTFSSLQI